MVLVDDRAIPGEEVRLAPGSQPDGNPGAALLLLQALQRGGVRHLVLCPGSRSAPLAVAAALLEPRGVRLFTAVDERSAAFLALGLGRASGFPAAVITTSGTAVANLLPAAVEADHGAIPLLLLTADRPQRLKGCGANQSVNQEQFLAASVRWLGQAAAEGLASMAPAAIEDLAQRALAASLGDGVRLPPGAVHLNLPFEEPLHATGAELQVLLARATAAPTPTATATAAMAPEGPFLAPPDLGGLDPDRPGVVVAGPWRGRPDAWRAHAEALRRWQRRTGWPVLADGLSGLRGLDGLRLVAGYDLLLESPRRGFDGDQVLRLGPLPASRRLQQWLQRQGGRQLLITEADPRPLDPLGLVQGQWSGGLAAWLEQWPAQRLQGGASPEALRQAETWHEAEARLQRWLDSQLGGDSLQEPPLARQLSRLLPPGLPLMLANSSPVRDWESFADPAAPARPIFGFRGASGIDGTLSIACGLAEALGQLVLLTGDLALLHDSNGWLWQRQLRGRLTVVLIDNGGGGIFEQLPIRTDPSQAMDFERLFAMPQAVDQRALAALHGVPGRRVECLAELAEALPWALAHPLALLELRTDRRQDADLRRRLRTMAP